MSPWATPQLFCVALLLFGTMLLSCQSKTFDPKWLQEKAPEEFTVHFETTKGQFDVEVHRAWSPLAADRMYQLIRHDYFDYAIFYRVTDDFVAQFGSSNLPEKNQWMAQPVVDEPVVERNLRGRMSFGRAGKDSRGSDLYINLVDNPKLDTTEYLGVRGYPPFGEVTKGIEIVDQLYDQYGDDLMQEMDRMYTDRNGFMQMYPGLDYIKVAELIEEK